MQRTLIYVAVTCAALGIGGAADAQEQVNPFWAKPVQMDLAERLFPGFAAMIGQGGHVTIRCQTRWRPLRNSGGGTATAGNAASIRWAEAGILSPSSD